MVKKAHEHPILSKHREKKKGDNLDCKSKVSKNLPSKIMESNHKARQVARSLPQPSDKREGVENIHLDRNPDMIIAELNEDKNFQWGN